MKLRLRNPNHRLSVDLVGFAKRAAKIVRGLREAVVLKGAPQPVLVVVGDGTPDNRALLALASALDGEKVADLAFPEHKLADAIRGVRLYAKEGYRAVVFTLDQERSGLEDVRGKVGKVLKEIGAGECREVGKRALSAKAGDVEVYIVINGLDDYEFERHAIEDHLLKAGEVAGGS